MREELSHLEIIIKLFDSSSAVAIFDREELADNCFINRVAMRIIKVSYQKPANLLIAAIQQYCKTLLADAMENNIANLKDLEDKVWQYAQSMQNAFPRCAFDKLDVISHQNVVHQFYNLIYNDTKPMITISARPDKFEAAFRDYDLANQHL